MALLALSSTKKVKDKEKNSIGEMKLNGTERVKRLPEVVLTLTGEVKILIGKKAVNAIKVTSVDAKS